MRLVFALFVMGVGVWLIVTARDPTETLTAQVSASRLPFPSRADKVDFEFADGSRDDVVSPTAEGFYDAVARFGPGPARVTRNEANDTIYEVEFQEKTYTLNSPGTDLGGGIIAVVLGGLGLVYVALSGRRQASSGNRTPDADESEPGSEPISDLERLKQLLFQVAQDIRNEDPDDEINLKWSRELRGFAGLIGEGKPSGLDGYYRMFSPDPRNPINDERFTWTKTFREASALAAKLWNEHSAQERRLWEAERGLVLRPWTAGSTGKAVVYADGTVVTSDDDAPGEPQFDDIKVRPGEAPKALIAIAPDGSCDAYWNDRDDRWLAAKLHAHNTMLHLVGPQPPRT